MHPLASTVYCDGTHDDASAIQALLTAGGTISLPAGTCLISNTLKITKSNTLVVGSGGGFAGDGSFAPGTGLEWTGGAGGTILKVGTGSGSFTGGGVVGVGFVSNGGLAGTGLEVSGWQDGTFVGLAADSFSSSAFTFVSTTENVLMDYSADNESNQPITCNAGAGLSVGLPGAANVQGDYFADGFITVCNGIGIDFNNSFAESVTDTQEYGTGSGFGVVFNCGSQDDQMDWLTPVETARKGVVVYGASTCGSGNGSRGSSIDLYDKNDNGAPDPVVASGTNFTCTNDAGNPCEVISDAMHTNLAAPACDGTTDDTQTIQNLINAGGVITLPAGSCIVTSKLTVLQSNVFLQGTGGSFASDGSFVPQTILKWRGANGTMLRFGNGAKLIQGGGIKAIALDS
ncbi:MAG TPA: hypothetical protein VHX68_04770, partial [Planctomycetaceae bacterium]|nr:hypothetical protein [Planctomycetaceae bacterium]